MKWWEGSYRPAFDAFSEADHPRDESGKFGSGGETHREAKAGATNQLTLDEQNRAMKKLDSIPSTIDSDYSKAFDLRSVRIEHLGMTDDGFVKRAEYPGGMKSSNKKFSLIAEVPYAGLLASQDAVAKDGLISYIKKTPDPRDDDYPEVGVTPDGKYHLLSGHTRASAAFLGGRTHVVVRLYQYDQSGKIIHEKPK